jgi:hypothetical protein
MEASGRGLFEVLYHLLFGGTEENHEDIRHSGRPPNRDLDRACYHDRVGSCLDKRCLF